MKLLVLLPLLLPLAASAHDMAPLNNPELATIFGLLQELATTPSTSDQPYIVRIYAAPTGVYECGGTVSSCPDVRLFFTVSYGDIGETPVLYQLPARKGWKFKGWSEPSAAGGMQMASFTVQTTLPDSNIDLEASKAWRPQEYRVLASPEAASYASH
ncbi:hypothetical protein [Xanthomonas arboricola]|uniref:hypothetical protein n=1 Tax=Xanthomonas arboricola TaxID=56448 RepID=UPI000F8F2A80|nr:hypothetical protein [Xanthomonas arboricola]CAD2243147.1 hypothetical protein X12_000390 [Xanthomonas arboricola]